MLNRKVEKERQSADDTSFDNTYVNERMNYQIGRPVLRRRKGVPLHHSGQAVRDDGYPVRGSHQGEETEREEAVMILILCWRKTNQTCVAICLFSVRLGISGEGQIHELMLSDATKGGEGGSISRKKGLMGMSDDPRHS